MTLIEIIRIAYPELTDEQATKLAAKRSITTIPLAVAFVNIELSVLITGTASAMQQVGLTQLAETLDTWAEQLRLAAHALGEDAEDVA